MWRFGITQLTILFFSCWYMGGLYGTIFFVALVCLGNMLFKHFGYIPISFADLGMSFELDDCTNNLVSYFEVGKVDFEAVKERIYEQGIKHIPTLRYVRADMMGISLFKIGSMDSAKAQVKKCDEKISNDEQVVNYCTKLGVKLLPTYKPLWEIHVLENYTKDTSLVFFVLQHSLMDAIGFVSLLSALLDNQFKLTMKKNIQPSPWYWDLVYVILGPFYTIYIAARFKMLSSDKG
jgi:hypothetical protein